MPSPDETRARWTAALAASNDLLLEFYLAASELVDDFEDYGPILQGNEDGDYDDSTAVGRLRQLRNALMQRMAAPSQPSSS